MNKFKFGQSISFNQVLERKYIEGHKRKSPDDPNKQWICKSHQKTEGIIWKDKFGFPTQMVIDAIGIKKPQTYIRYFNDLVDWGFIKLVQKSRNQYSSNIISLQSAMPKNGKALAKAIKKHAICHAKKRSGTGQSIRQSNSPINKPINQEPINQERENRARTREDFERIVAPLFEECPEEFECFCDYWCSVNQETDQMAWQEDPYFIGRLTMKVSSWIDRANRDNGNSTSTENHPHQDFLTYWIANHDPKNALIEAWKETLAKKASDLKSEWLIQELKSDSSLNLERLINLTRVRYTQTQKVKETHSEALKCATELEPSIEDLKKIRREWPEERFNQVYGSYLHLLEEAENTT